jgi:hypothetical protein
MYKSVFLTHLKVIKAYLLRHNGQANLDVDSCILEIRIGNQIKKFQPQFIIATHDGGSAYTSNFGVDVGAFVGWLPYSVKRWELSSEKLKIKEYLIKHKIPTPAYSTDPNIDMPNVIIKKNQSSFGNGIKGPFQSSRQCKIDASTGEFYEHFVMGKIAKIWYWNAMPVVLEIWEMPKLVGNGKQSIREMYLTMPKGGFGRLVFPNIEAYADVLALQGYSPETILSENESVVVDFKYMTPLIQRSLKNIGQLCNEEHVLFPQLQAIGHTLWMGIPEALRQNTAYSVDAMLDKDNVLKVLEMNSNPQLHPDIYPTMLESLFFNLPYRHQVHPPSAN